MKKNQSHSLSQRTIQGINSSWKFHKGEDTPNNEILEKGYWQNVSIPHTWNAEDVMSDEPGYYRGICWYEKEITIPEDWEDKHVYIHFEGASQVAEVLINTQSAGIHLGAYTAFRFNISRFLKRGTNTIRVKLDNTYNPDIIPVSGDWSVYGGIYRSVYLIAVNQNHFDMDNYASDGIFITTPQVSTEIATVQVKGRVSVKQEIQVLTTIYDREGNTVSEIISKPREDGYFVANIENIKTPHLWSPNDPYLYRIVNTLVDTKDGIVFDEVSNPLGFRWYRFDADQGFILNGKPCKIMGSSRHQDFKGLGSALPDSLHINDVQWIKDMGGNFMRVSHYPQAPAIMEACDRLGILAVVETPGANMITESEAFAQTTLEMQREMIRQNYNHPSVIIWAYMNEVLLLSAPYRDNTTARRDQYWQNVHDLAQKIETLCREEDPTRYTMIAYDEKIERYKGARLFDIPMIVGWNLYKGWYIGEFEDFETFLLDFHKEYPDKPMMMTEYGADSDYRLHSHRPSRFDKTQEYAIRFHEAYLSTINKYPFIAGGLAWAFADLVSESREEATPHLNTKGLLTADRKPKEVYYLYKAQLAKQSFVKIGGADWLNRSQCADEGSDIIATQPVTVYSNQHSVSLSINGEFLGSQKILNGKTVYSVCFRNGANRLRAISENGSEDLIVVQFHVIANNLKSQENPFTLLNVSLGDYRMFMDDLTNESWIPEQAYRQGSWGYLGGRVYQEKGNIPYGSPRNIFGTPYKAIYQTQRIGLDAFQADVPDGIYDITLHLSELQTKDKMEQSAHDLQKNNLENGKINEIKTRNFDIAINNTIPLQNLSSNNELIPRQAYSTKTRITVKEEKGIFIQFIPHSGESFLNGIQLRRVY